MSSSIETINKKILKEINNVVDHDLNDLIINSKALIAGGSLLSLFRNEPVSDVDIYVNIDNLHIMLKGLIRHNYKTCVNKYNYIVPAYDDSFFRQNNILGRFVFIRKIIVDIIVVKKNIPLISVVTNFDLTFCEIWYDGHSVNATDPIGIINKNGNIRDQYIEKLELHNKFTMIRLAKYIKKGYSIHNLNLNLNSAQDVNTILKNEYKINDGVIDEIYNSINNYKVTRYVKNKIIYKITSPEEFVVLTLYKGLINNFEFPDKDFGEQQIPELNNILEKYSYNGKDTNLIGIIIFATFSDFNYTIDDLNEIIHKLGIGDDTLKRFYKYLISLTPFRHEGFKECRHYICDILNLTCDEIMSYCTIKENDEKFSFVNVNENDIPSNCNDIILATSHDIDEIIADKYVIFINIAENNITENDIMCYERDSIKNMMEDKDNHFYECKGNLIQGTNDRTMGTYNSEKYFYIKFPVNIDGLNGFFAEDIISNAYHSRNINIFYIIPELDDDGIQKSFTHSVSWQNAYGPIEDRNFVSANHCQHGSNILLYTLAICTNTETCVKSFLC